MESLQSDAIQESTRAGQALKFKDSEVTEHVRKVEASGSGVVIHTSNLYSDSRGRWICVSLRSAWSTCRVVDQPVQHKTRP